MLDPIVLDSNLSVLLFVGLADKEYIGKHKRLQAYDKTDFDILIGCISQVEEIIFCPNVLTETSNLIRQIGDPIRTEIVASFSKSVQNCTEIYRKSALAVIEDQHATLGLTDSVLIGVARDGRTLLTADLRLFLEAEAQSVKAVNFNHLRDQRADFQ